LADRETTIAAFLNAAGWPSAAAAPLAGDASFRRYHRLVDGARRAVLMDAPPPEEDIRPFALVARHLKAMGFSAPGIYAEDPDQGLMLLEDLGDETYTRILDQGGDEAALYGLAVDTLIDLHRRPPAQAVPQGLAPYDEAPLLEEAMLLADWYAPAVLGEPLDAGAYGEYQGLWREAFATLADTPRTLVLRDYHVDNLMWLPHRPGVAACGLLDFQDALAGHPAYDLMSLLEDARRDISRSLVRDMRARYRAAFPEWDEAAFSAAFAILGAGRHAKVIGIFTRLCARDEKSAYLSHIPRVWRLLEQSLTHENLGGLAAWFARHFPAHARGIPPCPTPTT